jgi:hypothetical protein
MNTKNRVIYGHYDLKLIVGNKYRVLYGANQGTYVYEGQYTKDDSEFWDGASKFVNVENGQVFAYFGISSPYEFTTIVHPI